MPPSAAAAWRSTSRAEDDGDQLHRRATERTPPRRTRSRRTGRLDPVGEPLRVGRPDDLDGQTRDVHRSEPRQVPEHRLAFLLLPNISPWSTYVPSGRAALGTPASPAGPLRA